MKNFSSAEEALDFAIGEEQGAADFYNSLAERVERPGLKEVFAGFAKEEMGHKAKLEKVKAGNIPQGTAKAVTDLKIGDYLIDIQPSPELDYQDALILAMKKEKAAFRLYTDLAKLSEDDGLRAIFQQLAQEEAKHKLRFEIEYDENIMTDN